MGQFLRQYNTKVIESNILLIATGVLIMAAMYATVGHGGGSGYLAVLALAAIAPEQMRPTALFLNIVVASIATWKFSSNGTFQKELFIPLICASIPAAFVGGLVDVPGFVYKPLVGIVLLYAALRLCIPLRGDEHTRRTKIPIVIFSGICIGLLSGIIGIGGGIFLSPLILLLNWTTAKQTAAISAPFILLNSIAGLCGVVVDRGEVPVDFASIAPLAIAVIVGGYIGASIGSKHLGHQGLRTVLGIVLCIASIKMFVTYDGGTVEPPQPDEVKSTP